MIKSELIAASPKLQHHHQLRISRARYESDLARRRFMLVDAANRLVAAGLEAEWNAALVGACSGRGRTCPLPRRAFPEQLSTEMRHRIQALATTICRSLGPIRQSLIASARKSSPISSRM